MDFEIECVSHCYIMEVEDAKRKKYEIKTFEDDNPLKDVIIKLGEKMTSNNLNLEQISTVIKKEYHNYKESIINLILKCSLENPEKLTCYSTLVGLLNVTDNEIGTCYIETIHKSIETYFVEQKYDEITYLLIVLSDLLNVNVIEIASYLSVIEYLINLATNYSNPPLFKDWLINSILHCFPYFAELVSNKKNHKSSFNDIYEKLQDYMSSRNINQIRALRIWTSLSTDDLKQNEEIVVIWEIIQKMKEDRWRNDMINRLYENYEGLLSKGQAHPIQDFCEIITNYKASNKFPFPRLVFRLFTASDTRESSSSDLYFPANLTYHRHYAERIIVTMTSLQYKNRKLCAKSLLELNLDKTICLKYIITEVIFGQLLSLPISNHNILYYGSLFIELCNLSPKSFPIIIAQSVQVLFSKLDYMNIISNEKFICWFSNHLSNFQLKWMWDEWESYVHSFDINSDHPNLIFLKELICRLQRLYYNEKIASCLPSYMSILFINSNKHNFHYDFSSENKINSAEDNNVKSLINALIDMIKSSHEPAAISNFINSNVNEQLAKKVDLSIEIDDEENQRVALTVNILIEVLLLGGQKSISHTFAIISKYHKLIRDVVVGQEAEMYCIKTIHEFWKYNQIRMISTIDLFLRLRLISCYSIVNWIFTPSMQPNFLKFYVWEITENLLKRFIGIKNQIELMQISNDSKSISSGNFAAGESLSVKNCTSELTIYLETTLNAQDSDSDVKRLLLLIIQRFIMVLHEKVNNSKKNTSKLADRWFLTTLQRLQHIIMTYSNVLTEYIDTLDVIFNDEVDEHITEIYRRFKSLCC